MKIFSSNKLSKIELLELTIAQKKRIEQLQNEVKLLTDEVLKKDEKISQMYDLEHIINILVNVVDTIDGKLTGDGGKFNE